jgi:glycosyltransferase involved in cell wall biosynthesis
VVIENETALLSPSGDANAFANNLLKLIENDNIRNNFGKKGSQHVLKLYGFKRLAADMERLYDSLLKVDFS